MALELRPISFRDAQKFVRENHRHNKGYVGMITAKSGLMRDHGIITTGTIDAGYTGPISVVLFNTGDKIFRVKRGMKVAQLVIKQIITPKVEVVDELEETERGDGGFGSTGSMATK